MLVAWRGAWFSVALLLLCVLSLAPYLTPSTERVRLRHALLLVEPQGRDLNWTPPALPADFLQERGPVDPVFADAAVRLGLAGLPSDWARVSVISRHLLSHPHLVGSPVQSDLRDTYQRILTQGVGYCGDFTRVFMALALAAGMPVRAWSFSLDGFGGQGHIWPEVWNRQLQRWQLVDVFNNYYITGPEGVALSALDVRHALQVAPAALRLVPLHPGARPGYVVEARAWDYYRRGLGQWYLSWGNNVFSYDRAFWVRTLGPWSRSLGQLGGIAQGVYPGIRIVVEPANQAQVAALQRLRVHLQAVALLGGAALLALPLCLVAAWRARPSRMALTS